MNNILVLIFLNILILLVVVIAFRSGNKLLTFYTTIVYIANGIGSFFFLDNKLQFYHNGGSYTIKEFNFYIPSVISFYIPSLIFLIFSCLISFFINFSRNKSFALPDIKSITLPSDLINILFNCFIIIFLVLNFFMYQNTIGIVGLESMRLVLKLSGIIYYIRYLLTPVGILIFGLYLRQKSSYYFLSLLLIFITGICSASRSIPLMSLTVLVMFSLVDRRFFKAFVMCLMIPFLFQFVSHSRIQTYITKNNVHRSVEANLQYVFSHFGVSEIFNEVNQSIFTLTYRLGGMHDMILIDQAHFNNQEGSAIVRSVITAKGITGENIINRLFNFSYERGFAFGATLSPLAMIHLAFQVSILTYIEVMIFFTIILIAAEYIIAYSFRNELLPFISNLARFFVVYFFMSLEFNKVLCVLAGSLIYLVFDRYLLSIIKIRLHKIMRQE